MKWSVALIKQRLSKLTWFTGAQIVLLALNSVTGIILVWMLPKLQYAMLTTCNSMVACVTVICHPAIGTGTQALIAKLKRENAQLDELLATVLQLRWRLTLLVGLCWLPMTVWLLLGSEASYSQATVLGVLSLLLIATSLEAVFYRTVLLLNDQVKQLQKLEISFLLFRLIATVLLLWLVPSVITAVLVLLATYVLQSWQYSKFAKSYTGTPTQADRIHRSYLIRQFLHMLPLGAYSGIQGYIALWLLSSRVSGEALADFGALLRIGALFTIGGAIIHQWVIPRLSKSESSADMKSIIFLSLAGMIVMYAVTALLCQWLPTPFLWILGPQYSHLTKELPWIIVYLGFTTLGTMIWGFNTARGHTELSWTVPVISLVLTASAAVIYLPSTLFGCILFSSIVALPPIVIGFMQGKRCFMHADRAL